MLILLPNTAHEFLGVKWRTRATISQPHLGSGFLIQKGSSCEITLDFSKKQFLYIISAILSPRPASSKNANDGFL